MYRKFYRLFDPDKGGSTGGSTGETPTDSTPQGETPNTSGTGETPATTQLHSIEDAQKEIERLTASLKRANAEAKSHREKATELDTLKQQIENEKLSEKERLEKRLAALQKTHDEHVLATQERLVNAELRAVAAALGIKYPDKAIRLIERADLEYAEDGTPSNTRAVLETLIREMPELAGKSGTPAPNVGATAPARSTSSALPALSWEVITELQKNPEEYNRRNATGEISRWLQAHPFRYGQKN